MRTRSRIGLILLAILLVLTAILSFQLLKKETDPRVDAIRKRGYPMTIAELDEWYRHVPTVQNAALIYTNAFAQPAFTNNTDLFPDSNLPPPGDSLAQDDKQLLATLIATNSETLRMLYTAAGLPESRYPIDLKEGFVVLLPHLSRIKQGAILLGNAGYFHACAGENKKAVESFAAGARLAQSVAEEPLLISQLLHYAAWGALCMRLERAVSATQFSDEELARLQDIFAGGEKPKSLARGLAGEMAAGYDFFDNPRTQASLFGSDTGNTPQQNQSSRLRATVAFGALKATGLLRKDRSFFLDAMASNLLIAELAYPERFKVSQTNLPPIPSNRFYLVSRMLLPALTRAASRDAEHTARIRVARTALAVERFRLARGSLPSEMNEVAPAYLLGSSIDPIDGQSLRLKKTDRGYIVYSIGTDGIDNAGAPPNPNNSNAPKDVIFRVRR